MLMKEWGENAFIEYLSKQFNSPASSVGIGDDAAILSLNDDFIQLVTTDALVEGVHFLKDQISARDLGYKTLAVNVSDIAAMGGLPEFAFLTIAIPAETNCDWIKGFIDGLKEACDSFNVSLMGGDTVGSKNGLFLSMTLLGKGHKRNVKCRTMAEVGDIVCICGQIGSSGAGFKALQQGLTQTEAVKELIKAHFRPRIYVEEGVWLAGYSGIGAMMDLSDGLAIDLKRILTASKCGAVIDLEKLPVSSALKAVCDEQHWDAIDLALSGGEDYALLFTVKKSEFSRISNEFEKKFNFSLHPIGVITDRHGQLTYQNQGQYVDLCPESFDHFKE